MKIFYAVQATGNGHISRAELLFPILEQYGDVDFFLSGSNSSLKTNLPIAYRSKGVSFCYNQLSGGVDLFKTICSISPSRILKEARYLPVEKYDLVINDFECITSLACLLKRVPSVHFGHQASFLSKKVPRPVRKSLESELVLRYYARSTSSVGLHFQAYDDFIFPPLIRTEISQANTKDKGHITVYLGQYADYVLVPYLMGIRGVTFHVFSPTCVVPYTTGQIKVFPVNKELFTESLIHCHGIITGAGFETPSEALFLGKKLMVIPMRGQYEQHCNAAALALLGVQKIINVDHNFQDRIEQWLSEDQHLALPAFCDAKTVVDHVLEVNNADKKYQLEEQNNIYDLYQRSEWNNHRIHRQKYNF